MSKTATPRYDRTLGVVMWLDAFLSAVLAVASVVAAPIVAGLGLPRSVHVGLAIGVLVLAGLLAAFGAVTFVIIGMRLYDGDYLLPRSLRLPLPAAMRPDLHD